MLMNFDSRLTYIISNGDFVLAILRAWIWIGQ